jgi:hypothetical protein
MMIMYVIDHDKDVNIIIFFSVMREMLLNRDKFYNMVFNAFKDRN